MTAAWFPVSTAVAAQQTAMPNRPGLAGNSGGYGAPFHDGPRPPGFYTGRPPFRGWSRPLRGPFGRPPWRPPFWHPFMPGRPPYAPSRRFGARPGAYRGWRPSIYTYTNCVEQDREGSPRETGTQSATRVEQPGPPSDQSADACTALPEHTPVSSVKKRSPAQTKSDGSKRVLSCLASLDTHDGVSPAKRLKPHEGEARGDCRDGERDETKVAHVKSVGTEVPSGSIGKVPLPSGDRTGVHVKPEATRVRRSPAEPREPLHSRHSDGKAVTRKLKSVVRVPAQETVSSKEPTVCSSTSKKCRSAKVGRDLVPAELQSGFCKVRREDTESILSTSDSCSQQRSPNFTAHLILVATADSTTNQCTKQTANRRSSPKLTNARGIIERNATLGTIEGKPSRGTTESKVTYVPQVTFPSSNIDNGLCAETPALEKGRSETDSASALRCHAATCIGTDLCLRCVKACAHGMHKTVLAASISQHQFAKSRPTVHDCHPSAPNQHSADSTGDFSIVPLASFLGPEGDGGAMIRRWLENNAESMCSVPDGHQEENVQPQSAPLFVQQNADIDKPAQRDSDVETESIASGEPEDDCVIVGVENLPCEPTTSQRLGSATASATSACPEQSILQDEGTLHATSAPSVPGTGSPSEDITFEIGAHTALCILDFCRDREASNHVREIYMRGRYTQRKEPFAVAIRKVVCTALERKRVVWKGSMGVLRKLARLQWTLQAGYGPRIRELQEIEERWRTRYQRMS